MDRRPARRTKHRQGTPNPDSEAVLKSEGREVSFEEAVERILDPMLFSDVPQRFPVCARIFLARTQKSTIRRQRPEERQRLIGIRAIPVIPYDCEPLHPSFASCSWKALQPCGGPCLCLKELRTAAE